MDVSKNFFVSERYFLWNERAKEGILCKNFFSANLFIQNIIHLIVKTSENVVKSGYFGKPLPWKMPICFDNEERI